MAAKQSWDAESYGRNARFVNDLGTPVVELLAARPGERILDLGCGDGVLTRKLQDMGCELVGIDSSPELVRAAAALGLNVAVADASEMSFDGEFDALFSNAVLHWIKDADRVLQRAYAALRRGGRFVAECGGAKCVETIRQALMSELDRRGYDGRAADPWYFPAAAEYAERLVRAGFEVDYIEVIPRPTRLPGDLAGFLETFAQSFTAVLPPEDRREYIEDVRRRVKPMLCSDDGTWTADYTRLRFRAYKR